MILAAAMISSIAMPPAVAVPASCPATAVERNVADTPSQYPFLRVRPTFDEITMEMQTSPIGGPGTAYAPMRTAGTTVVWRGAESTVVLNGETTDGSATFSKVVPVLQSGNELTFPAPGCWKVHVRSGIKTGDLVLWVVAAKP